MAMSEDREKRESIAQLNAMQSQGAMLGGQCEPRRQFTNADIVKNHTPHPAVIQRIETIRAASRNFLDAIDANCPPCADSTDAKRKVREAMWAANSSLALDGAV